MFSSRLSTCCCCCSLKTGIQVLGGFEIFFLVLAVLGMVSASFFGLDRPYNIMPIYVQPTLVLLPKVVSFLIMCAKNYSLPTRQLYYRTRVYALIAMILIAIAQAVASWMIITGDYTLDDCNDR